MAGPFGEFIQPLPLIDLLPSNNNNYRSYNQGVILGGLSELARVTNNDSYTDTAKLIADAAINSLTDDGGILHDQCEPDTCGEDGNQFKGVFARNVAILQQQSPEDRYADFLDINADSVWDNDRNDKNQFGVVWSGFTGTPSASSQSSGLDVIVAALST
jgi:predicted alpha-1,6-mannanase (GH76 family)